MSLYREVGRSRRAVAIAAVAALLVGVAAGYALGRGSAPDPDLSEQVAEVGESVRPALSALELVEIHYPQAAAGEETAVGAAESQAAAAVTALEAQASQLSALDPDAYGEAIDRTREVDDLVGAGAPPDRVATAAELADAAIREAARIE